MDNQTAVSLVPLARHQRWPEPSGASTKRVYAMRVRRGIGPAGRAERKRLKRKAARDKFKAAHPNRKQELAAVRAEQERLANLPSAKFWCGAQLSDKDALDFIKTHALPQQPEAARKYLAQIDAECKAAGLNRNRFTLARGGVAAAVLQRRLYYHHHECLYVPAAQAVALAAQQTAAALPKSD